MCICVPNLEIKLVVVHTRETLIYPVVRVPHQFMCLEHEHVHQRGLAMMQVTNNCNIPNHFREGSHIQQESVEVSPCPKYSKVRPGSPLVEPSFRHVLFLHLPFSNFDGGNNGLCERLRILFLHKRLDVVTVHIRGRRVVLLVLVKNDSIMNGF